MKREKKKAAPDRGKIDITVGEWLAELSTLQRLSDGGVTCRELAGAWGCGVKVVQKRLQVLAAAGRLAVGFRTINRIDGRSTQVPVYRLKRNRGRDVKRP